MAFKIDFHEDGVREWHRTADGLDCTHITDYHRTLYVEGDDDAIAVLRGWLADRAEVVSTRCERKYTSLLEDEPTELLAVQVSHTTDPGALAGRIRRTVELPRWAPGTFRFYNVDLAPQFRYCLETGTDPTPEETLSTLVVGLDMRSVADRDISTATIDGEKIAGGESAVLETLADCIETRDPDVCILNDGALVPLLSERALACGIELQLGRMPGWTRLAGGNTYEHYGQVGYAAARYDVPGRVILDTSNSFLWAESSLAGLLYLVERSHKPLQETAWGSIGNILTSIQIREATARDIAIPWNKWDPESFKDVSTLHAADRGGFIMDPAVGLHEDVHELDFSSLYPYIMCEYNISPETICCACHADREDIPGIGYNVCDERGFITDVLEPLLRDRERAKERIRAAGPDDDVRDDRARSGAIKWILVSCFGYQGYRNSKFGRIECHEAINAVARDLFLRAKDTLETHGWEIVHGIVDSIWVTPAVENPTPIGTLAAEISADAGITLEHEAHHEWVTFIPRRGTDRGALTKYVAKRRDGSFKLRGIEARQRSTPPFVAEAQRDLLRTLDRHRGPEPVIDRVERHLRTLRAGEVPAEELHITMRVSQPVMAYRHETLTVSALRRADRLGIDRHPGQSVRFVVVDDDARTPERVRLAVESVETYDAAYYAEQVLRAAESVVAPLGWDRERIDRYRRRTVDARLEAFGE